MKSLAKTYSLIGLVALMTSLPMALFGQIKIFDNGNVGIKYSTSTPLSKLVLNNQGYSNWDAHFYTGTRSSSGGSFFTLIEPGSGSSLNIISIQGQAKLGANNYLVGVKGAVTNATALTNGRSYGVYGIAGNATSGYNYGVYGYLYGANNGAAIYGTSTGDVPISGKYAGYFSGNVYVTASLWAYTITQSDEKIKTNITPLNVSDSYDKISTLNPVKYNLKQREIASTDSIGVKNYYDTDSEFFKKPKYGFVAQEMREVYPDLVYESNDGTLGIDYTGLIPILVETIQVQQKKINELEAIIKKISIKLENLSEVEKME
jgi:hypothetical protein